MKRPKRAVKKKTSFIQATPTALLEDLRQLIEETRQGVAVAVNAALTLLYWRVGKRINEEILNGKRANYGEQILATVSQQLTLEYGRGWGEKHLRHCLRFAETFPDEQIVSALRRQLTWTHLKTMVYLDDPLNGIFTQRCAGLSDGVRAPSKED